MPANSQENAPVTRTPSVLFTGWTQCARLAVPDFYNIRDFFSHVQLPPPTPQRPLCSSVYAVQPGARGKPPFLFPFPLSSFFLPPLPFFSFPFPPPPPPSFRGGQNRERNRSRCAICICGVEKWPLISSSCRPSFFFFFSTEPRVEAAG